ncbi:MAG: hypothetical protein V4808_07120 [Pseudomonadota bacterium]
MTALSTLLKDLFYGGRNEYLDAVRLLAILGGLVFLGLVIARYRQTGEFDMLGFASAWVLLLGGTVAAIYGRSKTDSLQREDAERFPDAIPPKGDL